MGRFAVEELDQEDRAFVESIEPLHHRIEALKLVFPTGPKRTALESMQAVNACLVAAVVKYGK